jgi:hypothetical protein
MRIQTNGDDCRESGAGETSRHQFESWIRSKGLDIGNALLRVGSRKEMYYQTRIQDRWEAWQTSRAAIEITLPPKISDVNVINGIVRPEASAFDEAIDDCAEVLKEAGITVKE